MRLYDYYGYNPYQIDLQTLGNAASQFSWDNKDNVQNNLKNNSQQIASIAFGAFDAIGNQKYYNRQYLDNIRRRKDNYMTMPFDRNSYNSFATDFYNAYESGGEIDSVWGESRSLSLDENENLDNLIDEMFSVQDEDITNVDHTISIQSLGNIFPYVEKLKSMGLNPSSVNTGKHNEGSKHYHNKAVDLGLRTTFGGNLKKMQDFKSWFNRYGHLEFPGAKLIDETSRPNDQKVWSGSHFHIEI